MNYKKKQNNTIVEILNLHFHYQFGKESKIKIRIRNVVDADGSMSKRLFVLIKQQIKNVDSLLSGQDL